MQVTYLYEVFVPLTNILKVTTMWLVLLLDDLEAGQLANNINCLSIAGGLTILCFSIGSMVLG